MKSIVRVFGTTACLAFFGSALTADTPKEDAPKEPPATRAQFQKTTNNLKQIALAFHNYESAFQFFPPPAIVDKNGKALLSWRVAILPFIEEDMLYKEFKLDEPWDSDHNKRLLARMPKLYVPVRHKTADGDGTYYRVFVNSGALFESKNKTRIASITDGTSNTIMVIEAGDAVPWTKPDELEYDPAKRIPALGGMFDGDFHFALADGSVRKFRKGKKEEIMHKLITRAGGEIVNEDDWKP